LRRRTRRVLALGRLAILWAVSFVVLRWFPAFSLETYVAAGVATALVSFTYGVLLLAVTESSSVALEADLAAENPRVFRQLNRLAGRLFLLLAVGIVFATFWQYAWPWVAIVGSGAVFSVEGYLRLRYERGEALDDPPDYREPRGI
jgi:hypothetical protein